MSIRIGQGFDVHRLREGRDLVIGGLKIEFQKGLFGHSDADVLTHAVIDALLGAVALRDIGYHFPDHDPQYAEADSLALLENVARMVREAGYAIGNVDSTVIAEAPKLASYIEDMRSKLAGAMGIETAQVNVKAKTSEGLGAVGNGEAIAALAVALVEKLSS